MLYLIGHDKETGAPKTRWSNGFNGTVEDMLDTIRVFLRMYFRYFRYLHT